MRTCNIVAVTVLALGGLPIASTNRLGNVGGLRVSPDLHPKSDAKFFGKDYPDDLRPNVKDHFQYPFPVVQESEDYDKDYVKDENKDNGEWKAQTTYDHLRTKLSNLKSDAEHLKNKENDEDKDLQEAEKKLKDAEKAAKDAMDAANKAEEAANDAKKHLKEKAEESGNGTAGSGTNGTADNATGADAGGTGAGGENGSTGDNASSEVAKEEMDLEECMKQLGEAKEKVKKLMEDKAKRHEEHEAALANETKAAEDGANAANQAAKKAEARRKAEEAHQDSVKSYEEEEARLKQLQNDLEKKAERLRSFREKAMGKAGDLYHDPVAGKKSDAAGSATALPLFLALSVAGMLA